MVRVGGAMKSELDEGKVGMRLLIGFPSYGTRRYHNVLIFTLLGTYIVLRLGYI